MAEANTMTITITEHFTNLAPGKRKFFVQKECPRQVIPNEAVLFEIDEKYEIINILGDGGFGYVCMARDTSNNELVAVKMINLMDGTYCPTALRELQIHREVTQVRHPFIITFKGAMRPVDIDNFNEIYIVMEMVQWSLRSFLKTQARELEENLAFVYLDTKLIMYQLLKGLQYLQNAKVLHRDLKPSNILFDYDTQRIKLCDFGLARRRAPEMTTFVVTAPFRAPELFLSDDQESFCSKYGPAIDVWSLGCIFAEMLCPNPLAIYHLFPLFEYNIAGVKKIVEIIPPPNDDEIEEITDNNVVAEIIRSLPRQPSRPLRQILENLTDRNALDLLEKMLVFNPARRITVEEALEHEFLQEITLDKLAKELYLQPSEVEILRNPPTISVNVNREESSYLESKTMLFDACMNFQV